MGALLHQRRVLPLHGAAVRIGSGYVLVIGASGAGKSSLSAALALRGWSVGSDDISAVMLRDGRPYLMPGFPESKMWPDALAMLADNADHYGRVRPTIEKRRVPITRFSPDELPVLGVVVLTVGVESTCEMQPIDGGLKMTVLKHHTYRPRLALEFGAHSAHFQTIAALATHAPMWQLSRPRSNVTPAHLAALVEDAVVHLPGFVAG